MSWTKHWLRQLNIAEVDVRTCKAQASPFLSLKSLHLLENMEYALDKDTVISSFSTALQLEWRQLEVFHGQDVQFDGSFLQGGQTLCETEWLARTLKNKMWECVSMQDDEILNPCQQCSVVWKLKSEYEGKQNSHKFRNMPSSRVSEVLAFTETENLHVQEEDMFELPAHTFRSNLRLLAFIFTSLLLFVYLFL
jgi:hypothetical protein